LPNRAWQTGGKTYAEAGHNHKSGSNAEAVTKLRNLGRFPANLIHDGSEEVVGLFPVTGASKATPRNNGEFKSVAKGREFPHVTHGHDDNGGSAARFFYCAKTSKKDRDEGCEGLEEKAYQSNAGPKEGSIEKYGYEEAAQRMKEKCVSRNHHPTVKPTDLMRYLCRLVTPPGGIVLDPFMGSGTTAAVALQHGRQYLGCELNHDYGPLQQERIAAANDNLPKTGDLFAGAA